MLPTPDLGGNLLPHGSQHLFPLRHGLPRSGDNTYGYMR